MAPTRKESGSAIAATFLLHLPTTELIQAMEQVVHAAPSTDTNPANLLGFI